MLGNRPSATPLLFSYRSSARFAGPQLACYVTQTNARTHGSFAKICTIAALRVRSDSRRRSALLSVDRRQGREVRAQPDPSSLHRARRMGRADAVRRRIFYVAAGRGAARDAAHAAGLESATICAPAMRSSTTWCRRPSCATRWKRAALPASITAASSTAPRATKRRQPKGLSPESTPRAPHGARADATRAQPSLHRRARSTTSSPKASTSRIACSRRAREHRVVLRHDNADERLTPSAARPDSSTTRRGPHSRSGRNALHEGIAPRGVRAESLAHASATTNSTPGRPSPTRCAVRRAFSRCEQSIEPPLDSGNRRTRRDRDQVRRIRSPREIAAIEKSRQIRARSLIPDAFDYVGIVALSREAREKLAQQRPRTLGCGRPHSRRYARRPRDRRALRSPRWRKTTSRRLRIVRTVFSPDCLEAVAQLERPGGGRTAHEPLARYARPRARSQSLVQPLPEPRAAE